MYTVRPIDLMVSWMSFIGGRRSRRFLKTFIVTDLPASLRLMLRACWKNETDAGKTNALMALNQSSRIGLIKTEIVSNLEGSYFIFPSQVSPGERFESKVTGFHLHDGHPRRSSVSIIALYFLLALVLLH